MRIWCTTRDQGGTLGVLPVVRALRELGHTVELFITSDGAGRKLADAAGESYRAFSDVNALLDATSQEPRPDALITSMCLQVNLGRELTPLLRACNGTTAIVALQDIWRGQMTGAERATFVDPYFWPDYLAVNDNLGRSSTLELWPGFPEDNIWVTGYPALDRFANFDVAAVRAAKREQLNIADEAPVVLFAGQPADGTGTNLLALVAALNTLSVRPVLIARMHPRMLTEQWAEEGKKWDVALGLYNGRIVDSTRVDDMANVIAAADLVISEFSTANNESAAMRRDNITMQLFGLRPHGHELVQLGCSVLAINTDGLRDALLAGLTWKHGLGLKEAQAATFRLDGGNARRVAEHINQLSTVART